MKPSSHVTDRSCPLLAMQRGLSSVQSRIPRNDGNLSVVPGLFDAYRSNLVAPDHLLTGLARNVLDLCFQIISPKWRKTADICICNALAENGLLRERSVYNDKKLQLHTTSLSSVYCILLVSHPVLSNLVGDSSDDLTNEVLSLLKKWKDLISITHWNPEVQSDRENAYNSIRLEDRAPYVAALQGMAEQYVSEVDTFWKQHPEEGSVLDKPNLHRLLKLYYHTIPAFGHVSLVSELVFETAHHPLKWCISRGNNREAEVSAVEHCLVNNWQSRLAALYEAIGSKDETVRKSAIRGMSCLLLGTAAENVSMDMPGAAEFFEKLDEDIRKVFATPLIRMLKSNGNVNAALLGKNPRWCCAKGKPPYDLLLSLGAHWDVKMLTERGRAVLDLHIATFNEDINPAKVKWKARRVRASNVTGQTRTRTNEVLECGSVVQAMIARNEQRNPIVRTHGYGDSLLCFFVILSFLDGTKEDPWAVVVQCTREKMKLWRRRKLSVWLRRRYYSSTTASAVSGFITYATSKVSAILKNLEGK